jgi:hypothetical protein
MNNVLLRLFLLPGNAVCAVLGVTGEEDRMMLRTLVNMLVWNVVVIVGAFLVFA